MVVFPISKINIGLRITDKRTDGYHNIETIFYPLKLVDALEFVVSDSQTEGDHFEVTGIDTGAHGGANLVMKALLKLREVRSFPYLNIHLHKAIPAGAGLGGGSSDAACMLRAVNRHFRLKIDDTGILKMSLELGSDCPFFVEGVPSLGSGRGEILSPVKEALNGYYLVLVNPGVGINTTEAYLNCTPGEANPSLADLYHQQVSRWKGTIVNDFEKFAFKKFPVIGELKETLYKTGALFSLMSGSGSSVYGIFNSKPALPSSIGKNIIWEGLM